MTSTIAALGAGDPEMQVTAETLTAAGIPYVYAACDGRRVHPGTAYRADGVVDADGRNAEPRLIEMDYDELWLIECDGEDLRRVLGERLPVITIDHHRPGDPGYGRPPTEFLPASSIGQVISNLARRGLAGAEWWPAEEGWPEHLRYLLAHPSPGEVRWIEHSGLESPDYWAGWIVHTPYGWRLVGHDVVLVAAADHCLAAAYRGECPGVDPDTLMRWRAESRAAYQGRPVAEVLSDVERASAELHAAVMESDPSDCRRIDLGGQWAADLRGQHIPELPEAATREGICFVSSVRERDGRTKVVCQSGTPEQIRAFINKWAPSHGLVDIYGDPARGFAGGYKS